LEIILEKEKRYRESDKHLNNEKHKCGASLNPTQLSEDIEGIT